MIVGGSLWIYQYLRSDIMVLVLSHCAIVYFPGDSSGRTTSGGAGESEFWSSGIRFPLLHLLYVAEVPPCDLLLCESPTYYH